MGSLLSEWLSPVEHHLYKVRVAGSNPVSLMGLIRPNSSEGSPEVAFLHLSYPLLSHDSTNR